MRLHAKPVALTLAATLALAGCSAAVDPAAKDPMKTVHGFCNSVEDGWAQLVTRCYAIDADYVKQVMTVLRTGCSNAGSLADQGAYGYDRALAEQCMAMLSAASCYDDVDMLFQYCALALPGKVPPNGACTVRDGQLNECASGGKCYTSGNSCPGTCVVPGNLGEPCAPKYYFDSQCATGLVCDSTNRCVTPAGFTAACGGTNPPCDPRYYSCDAVSKTCAYLPSSGTCQPSIGCYSGKVCGYSGGVYSCTDPAPDGGDCSATAYKCVAGDYCRRDTTASSGSRCWKIPTGKQGVGGDCGYNSSACTSGLFCDYGKNQTCQPVLTLGAPCTRSSSGECGPGATCSKLDSETTGTCTTLKGRGALCKAGAEECLEGLSCYGTAPRLAGVCRPYGGVGSPCGYIYYESGPPVANNEYVRCSFDTFCRKPTSSSNAGTCAATVATGGSCLLDGFLQYSACSYYSGEACDSDTTSPTYGTCISNACMLPVGWFAR